MSNYLGRWFSRYCRSSRRRTAHCRHRHWQPQLELLEDRITPSGGNVTIDVNSTADILNPSPGTVTLRSAIQTANTDFNNGTASNVTINLTVPGTYAITLPGTPGEDDNAAGEFAIFAGATTSMSGLSLTIQNASGGTATVNGSGLARVFDINPGNITPTTPGTTLGAVIFNGLTVTGGIATDTANPDGPNASGGGIRDQGPVDLTLNGDTITGNNATADGGGVSMENTASTMWALNIANSTISYNHAGDAGGGVETDGTGLVNITNNSMLVGNSCLNQGGGVWLDAIGTGSATLNVSNTILRGNTAGMLGGGIGNSGASTVTITNSTLQANSTAGFGGGFADENNAGTLSVSDSAFLFNSSSSFGGGIVEGGPTTTIFDTEIEGNTAGGTGGGVWIGANPSGTTATSNSTFGIRSSTIADNTSTSTIGGGGIQIVTTGAAGTFTTSVGIQNSTIAGNTALNSAGGTDGGGINVATGFAGAVALINDTLTNNFASNGGGIFFAGSTGGTVTVQNTILANNTAATGPDANNPAGTFTDSGGNLVGNTTGQAGLTSVVTGPFPVLLTALSNNGDINAGAISGMVGAPNSLTPLLTMIPLPGSAAIGHGVSNSLTVDERGFPRGTSLDIGATAFQNISLSMTITATSSTVLVGGTATFNISVTNTSTTALPANNSTVSVLLPSGLTATSPTTFTLGALGAGSSQTFTVTATPTTTGSLTVTATLQSPDATISPITASVTVTGSTTPPPPPGPVGTTTFFAWGFGPGFTLDIFEVDSQGHVFAVPFFSTSSTPELIADSVIFANLSVQNGALIANLIGNTQSQLVDVFNPLAPFVFNALLASIGL